MNLLAITRLNRDKVTSNVPAPRGYRKIVERLTFASESLSLAQSHLVGLERLLQLLQALRFCQPLCAMTTKQYCTVETTYRFIPCDLSKMTKLNDTYNIVLHLVLSSTN
jgi:hypothetical protein